MRTRSTWRRGAGLLAAVSTVLAMGAVAWTTSPATAATVTGSDGLSVVVTAWTGTGDDTVLVDSPDGFRVQVQDAPSSGVPADAYLLSGLPTTWQVVGPDVVSVQPLIYQVPAALAATGFQVVAPAGFTGSLDLQVARASGTGTNILTDFDAGTFDYLGTTAPTLPTANTAYEYHDPRTLVGAPGQRCYNPQYSPCDGQYTIWSTGDLHGSVYHYNNRWADLRSVTAPLTVSTTTVCDGSTTAGGGPDFSGTPSSLSPFGYTTVAQPTYQVPDATEAAAGKFMVVNGDASQPTVATTTISGLVPGRFYSFSGFSANLAAVQDGRNPVQVGFFIGSTAIGTSQAMPPQDGCANVAGMWTEASSVFQATSSSVTISLRNASLSGYGGDFALDELSLVELATVVVPLAVETGSVSWSKVDEDGTPLAGSSWQLTGPDGYDQTFTDDGTHAWTADGLAWGTYTLTETAPTGYTGTDPITVEVTDGEGAVVDLGPVTNAPLPGSVSWSKVDQDGAPLAGSSWQLTGPDGYDQTFTDDGTHAWTADGLAWGTYTLTETAPTGYTGTDPITVEVGATALAVDLGPIGNTQVPGEVLWTKTDPDGAPLAGSAWLLVDADGTEVDVVDDDGTAGYVGADQDPTPGALRVGGLPWGSTTVTEVTAPVGYQLDPTVRTAEIGASTTSVDLGAVVDQPLPAVVTWQKVDPSGAPLAGSVWRLTGPDGAEVEVADATDADGTGPDVDPAPGAFRVEGLAWGDYTLTEVQAPAGYRLLTTPVVLPEITATALEVQPAAPIVNVRVPVVGPSTDPETTDPTVTDPTVTDPSTGEVLAAPGTTVRSAVSSVHRRSTARLAVTGADAMAPLAAAVLLLGAGLALRQGARRRHRP